MRKLRAYLSLTKPTIGLLVLVTGSAALVMEGHFVDRPLDFFLVLFALFLTAGSASAFNQYFEREVDARMSRTKHKRPLANGTIAPRPALVFAIAIGIAGCAIFWFRFNPLSAILALSTIAFYSFFYTLWLKPRTYLNIVIGGAAGAMGPIIAWAAATNGLSMTPWVLFLIIFFWTPPHFWALAYCLKEDYKAAKYPMLPLVKGDAETLRQILVYTVVTVLLTLSLPLLGAGLFYTVLASLLGGLFLRLAWKLHRVPETRASWKLFGYSIVYLLVLFVGLMVDAAMPFHPWKG